MRTDPIGIKGGINLFLYAKNCPIQHTDIHGLEPQSVNGYGPNDWRGRYVSNKPFPLVDFRDICNAHDTCYATCGKKKEECDETFCIALKARCHREWDYNSIEKAPPVYGFMLKRCLDVAAFYCKAVKELGYGPYIKAQECCP